MIDDDAAEYAGGAIDDLPSWPIVAGKPDRPHRHTSGDDGRHGPRRIGHAPEWAEHFQTQPTGDGVERIHIRHFGAILVRHYSRSGLQFTAAIAGQPRLVARARRCATASI